MQHAARTQTEAARGTVETHVRPPAPARRTAPPLGNQARLRRTAPHLQARLEIGASNDPLEREADEAAERVLRMPAPLLRTDAPPRLARACAACAGKDDDAALRRDAPGGEDPLAGAPVPDSVHDVLREPGEPLDPSTRGFMESRFGQDLGGVRIHHGDRAAASARSVGARAYALGPHVAFGSGEYRPGDPAGRRLLAHELAHVVQQQAAPEPAVRRDFDSTISICERVLDSRDFDVSGGKLSVSLRATLEPVGAATPCSSVRYYHVDLYRNGLFDRNLASDPVPFDVRATRSWSGLDDGSYHLRIWTSAANPYCCLRGDISVHTGAAAAPVAAPPLAAEACYDGDLLYVRKGGAAAACAALTGSVGEPTPSGRYCVRPQGEAQVSGGLRGRLFQDRSKWFLLEPQFPTTRDRMMLHPGVMSAGCITVTNRGCFDTLAAALNGGARSTAPGYDGYPPGNADGVSNPQRDVSCVGTLIVTDRQGGCTAGSPGGATAPPTGQTAPAGTGGAAPPTLARTRLRRRRALRREPAQPAAAAAGPDAGEWLTLFSRAVRDGSAGAPRLTLEQQKAAADPVLHDADKGGPGGARTPQQQAARDRIIASRAALPAVKFSFGRFTGGTGYMYGGRNTATPGALAADPAKAGDPAAERTRAVRQGMFDEVIANEGGSSAINAYDGARLTWGPGMTLDGPLPGVLTRVFADPTVRDTFRRAGVDWSGGAFLVFNEANDSIEQGVDALSLIQGRRDLLAAFVAIAESPDTGATVADAQLGEIDKRIGRMSPEMRDTWDVDALRVAFHIDWGRPADGFSAHKADYTATGGDLMKMLLVWGRSAAGAPEPNGASLISAAGFKLAIPQFQKWGHGVAWKAIQAVSPVPVTMSKSAASTRPELAGRVLIRTAGPTDDAPAGFHVIPEPPNPFPAGGVAKEVADPLYYPLYELNGVPADLQLGRVERYATDQLSVLIDGWDNHGLRNILDIALGLVLKSVHARRSAKKGAKSNPEADAVLASPDLAAVEARDPDRVAKLRAYLAK